MHAYGVGSHRHMPEIEQGLAEAAGLPAEDVKISFTPHLIPMSRGMLCTMIVEMEGGVTVGKLRECLGETYARERFVHVLKEGQVRSKTTTTTYTYTTDTTTTMSTTTTTTMSTTTTTTTTMSTTTTTMSTTTTTTSTTMSTTTTTTTTNNEPTRTWSR